MLKWIVLQVGISFSLVEIQANIRLFLCNFFVLFPQSEISVLFKNKLVKIRIKLLQHSNWDTNKLKISRISASKNFLRKSVPEFIQKEGVIFLKFLAAQKGLMLGKQIHKVLGIKGGRGG